MLTALILLILVGGIVYVSRRWPEIEARLFPDVAKKHRESSPPPVQTDSLPSSDKVTHQPPTKRSTSGVMRQKSLDTEPDVAPEVLHTKPVQPSPKQWAASDASSPATPDSSADKNEAVSAADEVADTVITPGGHVTGTPARPSQPAYVDATKGRHEDVDALAAEADQAYRDRDYERAETACLKILLKQPKNHKYMTRIGQIYQEMGQLEDAKEAYEAAKKLDPKNFFVLNRLAEVNRTLSDKGGRTKSTAKTKTKSKKR